MMSAKRYMNWASGRVMRVGISVPTCASIDSTSGGSSSDQKGRKKGREKSRAPSYCIRWAS